jgi:hypothetical protein
MASPGKKSFPLRIDPALWLAIERLAAQEIRSANAQVEYLLREALTQRGIRIKVVPDAGDPTSADPPVEAGGGSAPV